MFMFASWPLWVLHLHVQAHSSRKTTSVGDTLNFDLLCRILILLCWNKFHTSLALVENIAKKNRSRFPIVVLLTTQISSC